MSTRRALTGGTNDVNPQKLIIYVQQTIANGAVTTQTPVPISRFNQARGRAMVMEVLKVGYVANINATLNTSGSVSIYWQLQISTKAQTAWNPTDGTIIDLAMEQVSTFQPATAAAAAVEWDPMPIIHDLTDGAGHGIIVATDNIYTWFGTNGMAVPEAGWVYIWYRFKEVSLEEYIGVVQSQQS